MKTINQLLLVIFLTSCLAMEKNKRADEDEEEDDEVTDALTCEDADEFSGGSGTEDDPYLICDENDLEELDDRLTSVGTYNDYKDKYFKQTQDIDLESDSHSFLPLGKEPTAVDLSDIFAALTGTPTGSPFLGTYDGDNYEIKNMNLDIDEAKDHIGFFHFLGSTSVVKNITFTSPQISLTQTLRGGTVAGFSSGTIENITVTNISAEITKGLLFGGIVGQMVDAEKISDVTISGTIVGSMNTSYDVGTDAFEVDASMIGGIIGILISLNNDTELSDLTNHADITAGENISGIVPLAFGEFTANNLINNGDMHGKIGIAGLMNNIANGEYFGEAGLTPTVSNAVNNGDISCEGEIGEVDSSGAAGFSTQILGVNLTNIRNNGNITNNSEVEGDVAGLVSSIDGGIHSGLVNTGDVFLADNQVQKDGVTAADNQNVGGLFGSTGGDLDITISNCYSSGSITAGTNKYDIGGIIADVWALDADLSISNCYVANDLIGGYTNLRGAVIGQLDIHDAPSNSPTVTLTDVYWNTTIEASYAFTGDPYMFNSGELVLMGAFNETRVTGLTSVQMQDEANFIGFDFDDIWNEPTGSGFPLLQDI